MAQRTFPLNQPSAGRGMRLLEAITAVAILAALLALGARATGRLPDTRLGAIPDRPTRLLQMDHAWDNAQMRWRGFLRVLDPATGAATGETVPLHLPDESGSPVFSADGRTVAYADAHPPLTPPGVRQPGSIVTVADSVTGAIRWTAPFDLATFVMRLNNDGSRLILYRLSAGQRAPFTLLTVDVASGATLSTVTLPASNDGWPTITPDLRTAYLLNTHNSGTWPNITSGDVTLDLIDTATGTARAMVLLPMVPAGLFPEGRTIRGEPVIRSFSPGIVASPDSRRLYIVHPDASAVTVVNLKEGRVERTENIHASVSAAQRLFGWLMPQRVAAKEAPESTDAQASLAPDGHLLAITGTTVHPNDDGSYDTTDQGVRFVDLRTFTETGHVLQQHYQGYAYPLTVQWSADSRLLYIGYIISPTTPDGTANTFQLRVMDARSHAITATQMQVADVPTTAYLLSTWFALPQ